MALIYNKNRKKGLFYIPAGAFGPSVSAAFGYSKSSFNQAEADPTPTITGTAGGSFNASAGLVFVDTGTFNSSTGQIDLSASTIDSHIITYTVDGVQSGQTVGITAAPYSSTKSFSFDGVNDYFEIANDTSLQITDNLTLSCWINADNVSGTNSIIDKFFDGSDRSYLLRLQSSRIKISLGNTDGSSSVNYQSTSTLSNNIWYHIATTFSSTDNEVKIYINGSSDSTHSKTDLISTNTQALRIGGGYNLLNFFDGKIDEVSLWNTALSSAAVTEIYNSGAPNDLESLTNASSSNLVAWYKMGE